MCAVARLNSTVETRSSATRRAVSVEILSTAPQQWTRNKLYNKFTTNPGYSIMVDGWVVNYLRPFTTRRPPQVSSASSTVDEFCWPRHDRLAVAKFSRSRVWDAVRNGSIVTFADTALRRRSRKKASMPKTISIRLVVSIELRLVTDKYRPIASIPR